VSAGSDPAEGARDDLAKCHLTGANNRNHDQRLHDPLNAADKDLALDGTDAELDPQGADA
jgi:hypothetical protein